MNRQPNKTDEGNDSKAICRVSNVLRSPSPDPSRWVNTRRTIKWLSTAAATGVVLFVAVLLPRTRPLPEGYTYAYFPRGGHRYLIAPGGIKKVGQEVLDYHVTGTVVTGAVRLRLEHDDIRTFRLDLKTHEVTLGDPD